MYPLMYMYGSLHCFLHAWICFCSKTERLSKASESYKRSLKLNPFLWSSFESLCHIGKLRVS